MRLSPVFCRFAGLLVAFAAALAPIQAVGETPQTRVLVVGGTDSSALDAADLPAGALVQLGALPDKDGVEAALFGARLKAEAVSTLPDTRLQEPTAFEEFFLVLRAALSATAEGPELALGGDALSVPAFGARVSETVDAFEVRSRRVAFLQITDPDDAFPAAMPALRAALDPLGFDMLVVNVARAEAAECAGYQPLPFSIASGLADRAPFGDGNGATTMAEAERYLGNALRRAVERGCGPEYNLIFKARDDAGQVIVAHPLAPVPAVADRLESETFEAMFLRGSENLPALDAYLESCTYCPQEVPLRERMTAMAARARVSALEDQMWDEIRDDHSRDRLALYVDHCRLCNHSDEALTRIERLDAEAAAIDGERRAFLAAQTARDLAGLRAYVDTCLACAHGAEARDMIAELEADGAYQAERERLSAALADPSPSALQAYLDECVVCDGAGEVTAALDRLAALELARGPCVAAAGPPQMGGPRKFEEIDPVVARAACDRAAADFPQDGLLRVLGGRIAQATGDIAAAEAAYAFGIDHGVPAAYGLAAFAAYSPEDGGPIDPLQVEELAREGAALGDWLSQEVLTVLYSKDLVPGKSGREAFDVAMKIAREGDPLAQFFVGHYYLTGVGVELSEDKAADWLQAAVDAGYIHASAYLAELHERGVGGGARPDLAAELYWRALQQGDATAGVHLTTDLASRSAEVVRIIQGKLREQGLYQGVVDGVPGPGTEAAIRAYTNSLGGQG